MDAYKILEIDQKSNFTIDDLKRNFKKLAFKYHPDSSQDITHTPMFQTLIECYKVLLQEIAIREQSKPHHVLKNQFNSKPKSNEKVVDASIDPKKFDSTKFNNFFEKHKIKDDYEQSGYGDWFASSTIEDNGAIINYEDPEALLSAGNRNFYELGKNTIEDYSADNLRTNGTLNYMDLKKAYTTTQIVNEKFVEKKPIFKNLEDVKKSRASVQIVMSQDDIKKYHMKKEVENQKEQERLKAIKEKDSLINQLYEKTNKLMVGFFKN